MNSPLCVCRRAALRIFVQNIVVASSPRYLARQHFGVWTPGLGNGVGNDRSFNSSSSSNSSRRLDLRRRSRGAAENSTRWPLAVVHFGVSPARRLQTSWPTFDAEKVIVTRTPTADDSETGGLTAEDRQAQEAQGSQETQGIANTDTPASVEATASEGPDQDEAAKLGKNKRKKLRRQKETEEAAALTAAAAAEQNKTGKRAQTAKAKTSKTKASKAKTAGTRVVAHAEDAAGAEAAADAVGTETMPTAVQKARKRKPRSRAGNADASAESPSPSSLSKFTQQQNSDESQNHQYYTGSKPTAEPWQIQKHALRAKFPDGWQPRKKLSPDALEGVRALHRQFPDVYTTPVLAQHFQVSPEAIRRILRSKWQVSPAEEEDRQTRWFKRGMQVWTRWAALGKKPPKRWQAEGIRRDAMSWPGGRRRQQARQQQQYRHQYQQQLHERIGEPARQQQQQQDLDGQAGASENMATRGSGGDGREGLETPAGW